MDAITLQKIMDCSSGLAETYADLLTDAMAKYQIDNKQRVAAFLAQIGHESDGLIYTREIWGPTAWQARYEGRVDLGNVYPGDGFKFRGRGLIQITGRSNYEECAHGLSIDCENYPDLLEEPKYASLSAAWWWNRHGCNDLADKGQFDRITRTINGGLTGSDDRHMRWERAKSVLDEVSP